MAQEEKDFLLNETKKETFKFEADKEENKSVLNSNIDEKLSVTTKTEINNQTKPMTKQTRPAVNNDQKNLNIFLSPMLDDIEKAMAENMKALDKIEEELLGDKLKSEREAPISHIPKEIRKSKSIESIMRNLEEMIISANELDKKIDNEPSQQKNKEFLKTKLSQTSDLIYKNFKNKQTVEFESSEKKIESNENGEEEDEKEKDDFGSTRIGKLNNLACLANSLSAYLITTTKKRNTEKLRNLTIKIYDSVNLWLSRLFRFYESSVLFHDQEPDGLIRMCYIMLNCKFNNFQKNAYFSMKKQPTIYISAASKYALPEYREVISIQLGLPYSSIKLVQVTKASDNTLDKIDIPLLIKQLDEDIDGGLAPLLIVANAGSHDIGQCDDLQQLNQIATTYKMWVHLEGVYLSTLILYSVPTAVQPVMSGDSITIDFGSWIGVPSLSYVTIYRNVKNSNLYLQPFNCVTSTLNRSLPYWCVLQAIGHSGVVDRIQNASNISYYINDIVQKFKPHIKILTFKNNSQKPTITKYSFTELVSKALSILTFVDLNNPLVLFKCDKEFIKERLFMFDLKEVKIEKKIRKNSYKEEFIKMMRKPEPELLYSKDLIEPSEKEAAEVETQKEKEVDELDEYTDTLTTWLCDLLNSLHKNFDLELIEIENEGTCIRFCPLDHVNIYGTSENDIRIFDKSFQDIIAILDASIKCKSIFDKEIKEFKNLLSVKIPKWAGIGAVRYVPDHLLDKLDEISNYLIADAQEKEVAENEENLINLFANENKINKEANSAFLLNDSSTKNVNEAEKNSIEHNEPHKPTEQNETVIKYIKQINDLNIELVKKLQTQDGAFSIGEATDSMNAIKLGMVNETDNLKKLACQIQDVGKEVEESTKLMEKMNALIIEGIEKANESLRKENENKLIQQGVLRQIPLVSGLFNWLAPIETSNITGRTFDLQSGKIESTETIYKKQTQDDYNSNNSSGNNDLIKAHESEETMQQIENYPKNIVQENQELKSQDIEKDTTESIETENQNK